MPHFKNDLKELLEDFQGTLKGFFTLVKDLSEAPPTIRKQPDVAFARLTHATKGDIGAFAPELYEIAREGNLKAQLEYKAWKNADPATRGELGEQLFYSQLFYTDVDNEPKLKTPFELAILPYVLDLDGGDKVKFEKNVLKCEKRICEEFDNLKKEGIKPPLPVHKYRIQADYLRYAEGTCGIKVAAVYDIVVNRANPKRELTRLEKYTHWLAQRAAFISTLAGALIVGEIVSPVAALATIVGSVLANLCVKEFGMFGLAESLIRELPRMTFKDIFGGSDTTYSFKKILKTIALLGALVMPTYAAAYLGWESIMLLSLPVSKYWAINTVLQNVQMVFAGFFAIVGAATLVSGATLAQRYFWGLGVQDTQISLNDEVVARLSEVCPKSPKEKVIKHFDKIMHIMEKNVPQEQHGQLADIRGLLYRWWSEANQPAPQPELNPTPEQVSSTSPTLG